MKTKIVETTLTIQCNGQEMVINAHFLPAEIREALMMHGLKQKIVDSAASKTLSEAQKFEKMQGVLNNLKEGNWNAGRSESGKVSTASVIAALAAAYGKSVEWAEKQLAALAAKKGISPEEAAAIFADTPQIKAELLKARTRHLQSSDDFLSDLGDLSEEDDLGEGDSESDESDDLGEEDEEDDLGEGD